MAEDNVDRIIGQWGRVKPALDVSPLQVVGRISRLSRLVDRRLGEHFAAYGIESWMYDVLATLRRSGKPYELSPTDLVAQTMVTTGAMTNRIDRLVERGFVEREHDLDDRRRLKVRLTLAGRQLVDAIAPQHYALEAELLASLSKPARADLERSLRLLLLDLGDRPLDD